MQINKITDIFFDLDHTLWDFETNSSLAFKKLFQKYQIPIQIDTFIEVYEPINKKYWNDYAKGLKTKDEVKYNRLIDTFNKLEMPLEHKLIEKLANGYLDFLQEEKILIKGTVALLDYLKSKYKLHILTNGFKEVQERKMKNSDIAHYFDQIISSEEAGNLKPHPNVFNYALQKANTFAHNSYMIGDNLKSDILGAHNVGMYVIHFDPDNESDIDSKIIPKVQYLHEIREML